MTLPPELPDWPDATRRRDLVEGVRKELRVAKDPLSVDSSEAGLCIAGAVSYPDWVSQVDAFDGRRLLLRIDSRAPS